MKKYITTVRTNGLFKNHDTRETWSSNVCSVCVAYDSKKDKPYIVKVWRQRSMKSDTWIHPQFNEDSMDDIRRKVKWNYDTFVLKENILCKRKDKKDKKRSGKHHLEEKCERCVYLGRDCQGDSRSPPTQEDLKD